MSRVKRTHLIDERYPEEFEEVSGYFWTACGKPIKIEDKGLHTTQANFTDCKVCQDSRYARGHWDPGSTKYLKIRREDE